MKYSASKCFFIALSLSGAMIGVGLASGREIVSFFTRFGAFSFVLCLISCVFFALLSYLIFTSKKEYSNIGSKIKNAHQNKKRKCDIEVCAFSLKCSNNDDINPKRNIQNYILFTCQVSLCSAMFAGANAILKMIFTATWIRICLFVIVYFVAFSILYNSKRSVFRINVLLSVCFVLTIIIMFFVLMSRNNFVAMRMGKVTLHGIFMPVLYAGMNILTIFPLLQEVSKQLDTKKQIIASSIFIGLIIFLILTFFCFIILCFGGNGDDSEMVMIDIAGIVCPVFKCWYILLMLLCVFSTLLSTAYGALKYVGFSNKMLNIFIVLTLSAALSCLGFSKIVDIVYPVLGLMCLGLVFANALICKRTQQ